MPFSPTQSFDKRKKHHATSTNNKPHESRRKSSADVSDLSAASPPPRTSSRYLLSDNPIFDFLSESQNASENSKTSWSKRLDSYLDDFPVFRSSSARSHEAALEYKNSVLNDLDAYVQLARTKDLEAKNSSSNSKELAAYNYKASNAKNFDLIAYKESPTRTTELIAYKSSPARSKDLIAFESKELDHPKTSSTQPPNQVVELKVSIHCKGCEGKIRKHISRMEGVTSFSIDLATKKVTVVGNVTPLGVLSSVSKVKYAEFWSSPNSSSSTSSSPRLGNV